MERFEIFVMRAIIQPNAKTIPVRILNTNPYTIKLYKNTRIGTVSLVDDPDRATESIRQAHAKTQAVQYGQQKLIAVALPSQHHQKPQNHLHSEHQQKILDLVSLEDADLTNNQKEELQSLLRKYHGVFASDNLDLGRTKTIQHQIDTQNNCPVKQVPYRLPVTQRTTVAEHLTEMLDAGVIQPSLSPWASPIVLVPKKGGTTRFYVDYRKLNSFTKKDCHPLPRTDDILNSLSNVTLFSTLDLASGYWQIPMNPMDQEKTAFTTFAGLFEFTVLPFGLCNAPSTFQRLMEFVLAGLTWKNCLVYIDDILVFSKDFASHLKDLKEVFECLQTRWTETETNEMFFSPNTK